MFDIYKYGIVLEEVMPTELRERIAGDIALSDDPGRTIRKWREEFSISQQQLAKDMGVSYSVVSDYESGRRKSPGVGMIRKMVDSFIRIDIANGSPTISKYFPNRMEECIIAMEEFPYGIDSDLFIKMIGGVNLNQEKLPNRKIYGYTIVDSLKAIISLSSADYLKIYGWSTERALIFTNVHYGRSPMVAIRAHPLTPAMVVYLRPDTVDPLAIKLSKLERIPLVSTNMDVDELVNNLNKNKEGM